MRFSIDLLKPLLGDHLSQRFIVTGGHSLRAAHRDNDLRFGHSLGPNHALETWLRRPVNLLALKICRYSCWMVTVIATWSRLLEMRQLDVTFVKDVKL